MSAPRITLGQHPARPAALGPALSRRRACAGRLGLIAASALALVACGQAAAAAPVLGPVEVRVSEGDHLVVRWSQDRPADAIVSLDPLAGGALIDLASLGGGPGTQQVEVALGGTVADGRYRVRVEAMSRTDGDSAVRSSDAVVIDATGPEVTGLEAVREGGELVVSAQVSDPGTGPAGQLAIEGLPLDTVEGPKVGWDQLGSIPVDAAGHAAGRLVLPRGCPWVVLARASDLGGHESRSEVVQVAGLPAPAPAPGQDHAAPEPPPAVLVPARDSGLLGARVGSRRTVVRRAPMIVQGTLTDRQSGAPIDGARVVIRTARGRGFVVRSHAGAFRLVLYPRYGGIFRVVTSKSRVRLGRLQVRLRLRLPAGSVRTSVHRHGAR